MIRFLSFAWLFTGSLRLVAFEYDVNQAKVHAYDRLDACKLTFSLNIGELKVERTETVPPFDCDRDVRDFSDSEVIQNACYTGDVEGVRNILIAMIQDLDWSRDCWPEDYRIERNDNQFHVWLSWMDEEGKVHKTEVDLVPCSAPKTW